MCEYLSSFSSKNTSHYCIIHINSWKVLVLDHNNVCQTHKLLTSSSSTSFLKCHQGLGILFISPPCKQVYAGCCKLQVLYARLYTLSAQDSLLLFNEIMFPYTVWYWSRWDTFRTRSVTISSKTSNTKRGITSSIALSRSWRSRLFSWNSSHPINVGGSLVGTRTCAGKPDLKY